MINLPKPEIDRNTAMELWISDHSDYAKEQLTLNNAGLVSKVLKSLDLDPSDEDLFSTGILAIIKAINTFSADKGVTFSTYAVPIIRNEILMIFRKKRIIPAFSLDEPCVLTNGDMASWADVVPDESRFEEDVIAGVQFKESISFLDETEKTVILLRMEGKKQAEMAEICGISQSYVSRIIKNACEKFKAKYI